MSDDAVTLLIGSISILCGATLDEARVTELRDATPEALTNWSDVIELLRSIGAAPVVQLAFVEGKVVGLIHGEGDNVPATAFELPAKAKGYDVLAKILRGLEYQYRKRR